MIADWSIEKLLHRAKKSIRYDAEHTKRDTDKKCNICNKVHGTIALLTKTGNWFEHLFSKALFVKAPEKKI